MSLGDADAQEIFGSLHFLRSFRTGAQYFALQDIQSGAVLSCCGVAPLRWQIVADALAKALLITPGEILDLCRMYTLPGAPGTPSHDCSACSFTSVPRSTRRHSC